MNAVIDRHWLQQSILSLVATLPGVHVQNRLMSCTDRDVALALMGLTDDEIGRVLSHVSGPKARRIIEEVQLQQHRHADRKHLVIATLLIVQSLRSEKSLVGTKGYLRPRRPKPYERSV